MGMFGGLSTKIGLAGDILSGNPVTQNRLQQQQFDAIRQAQLAAARQKVQAPLPPDVIRELQAANIDPTSATGQQAILGHLRPPQYFTLGNPETGQQLVQVGGAGGMSAPATAPAAPAIGTVMQGYRYNGGDPSQQASWTKVP